MAPSAMSNVFPDRTLSPELSRLTDIDLFLILTALSKSNFYVFNQRDGITSTGLSEYIEALSLESIGRLPAVQRLITKLIAKR
jgi:hypothetical protein